MGLNKLKSVLHLMLVVGLASPASAKAPNHRKKINVGGLSVAEVSEIVTEEKLDLFVRTLNLYHSTDEWVEQMTRSFSKQDKAYFQRIFAGDTGVPEVRREGLTLVFKLHEKESRLEVVSLSERRFRVNGHSWVVDRNQPFRNQYEVFKVRLFAKDQFSFLRLLIPEVFAQETQIIKEAIKEGIEAGLKSGVAQPAAKASMAGETTRAITMAALGGLAATGVTTPYCWAMVDLFGYSPASVAGCQSKASDDDEINKYSMTFDAAANLVPRSGDYVDRFEVKDDLDLKCLQGKDEKGRADGSGTYQALIRPISKNPEPYMLLTMKFRKDGFVESAVAAPETNPNEPIYIFHFKSTNRKLEYVEVPNPDQKQGLLRSPLIPIYAVGIAKKSASEQGMFAASVDLMKYVYNRVSDCHTEARVTVEAKAAQREKVLEKKASSSTEVQLLTPQVPPAEVEGTK